MTTALDTPRVLASAARLVQQARQTVPWYAGHFAPIRTDQVNDLMRAHGCRVVYAPLDGDTEGMALPRLMGVCPVVIAEESPRTERMLIVRHELAHVLSGDVEEPTYLAADDAMSHGERTADLFALADLLPGWLFADFRRARMSWRDIHAEVHHGVWDSAQDWPEDRIVDRARLRVQLYRQYGI